MDVKSSRDIRREVSKKFEAIAIRQCQWTAGGSVLLELHDEESANNVKEKWDTSMFGIASPGQQYCNGIIKEVDDEFSEDQIKEEITKQYPGAATETFKRGKERIFTGTVKIKFTLKQQLEMAMQNKAHIGYQCFYVEEFINKPHVIKCHRCQKFGHVSARCKSRVPVCGKCSSKQHETKDCSVSNDKDYKCYHCHKLGDHMTGDKICVQ